MLAIYCDIGKNENENWTGSQKIVLVLCKILTLFWQISFFFRFQTHVLRLLPTDKNCDFGLFSEPSRTKISQMLIEGLFISIIPLHWCSVSYLIFVISFTQAICAVEIFYTQNALFVTKLNMRQNNVNRSNALCKIIHCGKIPIYCVKSPIQCKITCCGQNCTLMFDYTMKIIHCLAHFV